ncbi:hypothetical protein L915_19935 [Phytophthora nicotianae]|uniref:Uncharacterized protein n=3 Tax=Phytophthora nicotianae TaxID=4792 RepID=W2QU84_PHYN3|nr:hypothetical protein PPTG_21755 [Phytophthora nicotianae INRA-310]ETI32742.1 hypothetical protein F443_20499 [Phytophthora nicotianae P1569]ETK73089.1 hypothetical protein L915_19935 [Phytophthora nicotianae]ETM32987.1 hypothetical protein L914_19715 [Phytophthora nicotianae]ETN16663.1 hypothetical protein PPTG_21755 [Phytophthora nicotianae INRA-310]
MEIVEPLPLLHLPPSAAELKVIEEAEDICLQVKSLE